MGAQERKVSVCADLHPRMLPLALFNQHLTHAHGRFMVQLDGSGKQIKVKPENLTFEDPDAAPLAAMASSMSAGRSGEPGFTCAVCYEPLHGGSTLRYAVASALALFQNAR